MDINTLISALEDDNNLNIIQTNLQDISKKKNDILQQLNLDKLILKEFNRLLKQYMYVEELMDIKEGHVIRYINLKNSDNIKLSKPKIICNVKNLAKGLAITVKIFNNNYITLYLSEILLFKKISDDEKILLKAVKLLQEK